jgi:hypothetical protein
VYGNAPARPDQFGIHGFSGHGVASAAAGLRTDQNAWRVVSGREQAPLEQRGQDHGDPWVAGRGELFGDCPPIVEVARGKALDQEIDVRGGLLQRLVGGLFGEVIVGFGGFDLRCFRVSSQDAGVDQVSDVRIGLRDHGECGLARTRGPLQVGRLRVQAADREQQADDHEPGRNPTPANRG